MVAVHDLSDILAQRLQPAQVEVLRRAAEIARQEGVSLYLVGGTVRDILLGQRAIDTDLSFAGGPPHFPSALAERLGGQVLARSQFGTCKLRVGALVIDLAQARQETYAYPGALPSVSPGSMEQDLARRDFSINAMAIHLADGAWGQLQDPFGGRDDLESSLVRVLHARSFADDATRILRAVRYAGRLGFRLEEATHRLLLRDLGYLDTISGDRLRHELARIFREAHAVRVLRLARDLGVLAAVHPSLYLDDRTLKRAEAIPAGPEVDSDMLFLAALTFNLDAGQREGLINRLNMDARWARVVRDTGAVRSALAALGAPQMQPSQVYMLLRPYDSAAIEACMLLADAPLARERLSLYLSRWRHEKPLLKGNDLIGLGVPEGPEVGRLLHQLLVARLDGLLSSREDEVGFVRRSLR